MERKSAGDNKKRKPSGAAVVRRELTVGLYRALFEEGAETGYTGTSLERVAERPRSTCDGKAARLATTRQHLRRRTRDRLLRFAHPSSAFQKMQRMKS
jgi:hypothetical protein